LVVKNGGENLSEEKISLDDEFERLGWNGLFMVYILLAQRKAFFLI